MQLEEQFHKTEQTIRSKLLHGHKIKEILGNTGFQRILFENSKFPSLKLEYILSNNYLIIASTIGSIICTFPYNITLEKLKNLTFEDFVYMFDLKEEKVWYFSQNIISNEIEKFFVERENVKTKEELNEQVKKVIDELQDIVASSRSYPEFETEVMFYAIKVNSDIIDMDSVIAITNLGRSLHIPYVVYFVGLKMILEELEIK